MEHTTLPWRRDVAAEWVLGIPATGLDLPNLPVRLADGLQVPFDHLLIATGTRARPWPDPRDAQRVVLFAEAASIARSMLRLLSGKGSETVFLD